MSYEMTPTFTCAMCGAEGTADLWATFLGITNVLYLPDGWSGSKRKDGECYCDKCTRAIFRVREEMGVADDG